MATFDDEWADDFQRRMNERLFGGWSPEYVIYDEAFGNIGHPGKYRTAFGTPSYGPPKLRNVFRCECGASEADHDDDGKAYGIGVGCKPYAVDELREMIKSWL